MFTKDANGQVIRENFRMRAPTRGRLREGFEMPDAVKGLMSFTPNAWLVIAVLLLLYIVYDKYKHRPILGFGARRRF